MTSGQEFGLFLFTTDGDLVRRATRAGLDGFVVDWEHLGKEGRQSGADTQVNHDTPDDLSRVRAATDARVLCRINGVGAWTPHEVEDAVARGADEILVPMVRRTETVLEVLELVRGRAGVAILVETDDAVRIAPRLAELPLSRVYVGLNDLMIDRGSPHLFRAVEDGTVERVRAAFRAPFGFAGLTSPDRGAPVPCRLLVGEMARLRADFTFLRRSFLADVRGRDLAAEVRAIRAALAQAARRSPADVRRDHDELLGCLESFPPRGARAS